MNMSIKGIFSLLLPIIYFSISWLTPWEELYKESTISISYLFDIIFCILVFMLYPSKVLLNFDKGIFKRFMAIAIFGIFCISITIALGLNAPFKFVDQLFIQILILAPFIEEFVFRSALFEPMKKMIKNKSLVFFINALLFSISHAWAMTILPEEFHEFIYFQLGYTFVLGWICAKAKDSSQSMIEPILLHFIFNFIFFLAVQNLGL